MRLSAHLPVLILLWLVAEVFAFGAIARAAGLGGALLLCLLTSVVGFAMLRRLGISTAWRLQQALAARSHEAAGVSRDAVVDGGLAAVGSILLILPGFVSDFVGLALAAPSVRAWLGGKLQTGLLRRSEGGPATVELDPREWSRTEGPAGARPAAPKLGPGKLSS